MEPLEGLVCLDCSLLIRQMFLQVGLQRPDAACLQELPVRTCSHTGSFFFCVSFLLVSIQFFLLQPEAISPQTTQSPLLA